MIIDVVITLIIVFGLIIGIFRNPIMSVLHLILFVAFTFAFYPLYAYIVPLVLESNSIILTDIASTCANAISIANNEIVAFGESIGLNLNTFSSIYVTPAYFEALLKGCVNTFAFLISSIISLILSYGISWIAYGLIKNHGVVYQRIKIKLSIRVTVSFVSTALFIFFALSCISSPYQIMVNNYQNIVAKVNTIHLMESVDSEYQEVQNLISEIRNTSNELTTFEDRITKMNKDVYSKYSYNFVCLIELSDMDDQITTLLKEVDSASINYNKKTQIKKDLNSIKLELPKRKESLGESSTELFAFEVEFDSNLALIEEEKNKFQADIDSFESSVETLTSLDEDIEKYRNILNEYANKLTKSNWYNFLFSINYGFLDFKYEGEKLNFTDEINDFLFEIDTVIEEDLKLVKAYMTKEVENNSKRLDEVNEKIEGYKDDLTKKEEEYAAFVESNDELIKSVDQFILESSNKLTEIEKELGLIA